MTNKEIKRNKENDKHEDAESVLHNTSSRTQCLYKLLGAVVLTSDENKEG